MLRAHQIGDGSLIGKDYPVNIGLTEVVMVTAGAVRALAPRPPIFVRDRVFLQAHTCAVVGAGGALYCWGQNNWGQVGFAACGDSALWGILMCMWL